MTDKVFGVVIDRLPPAMMERFCEPACKVIKLPDRLILLAFSEVPSKKNRLAPESREASPTTLKVLPAAETRPEDELMVKFPGTLVTRLPARVNRPAVLLKTRSPAPPVLVKVVTVVLPRL